VFGVEIARLVCRMIIFPRGRDEPGAPRAFHKTTNLNASNISLFQGCETHTKASYRPHLRDDIVPQSPNTSINRETTVCKGMEVQANPRAGRVDRSVSTWRLPSCAHWGHVQTRPLSSASKTGLWLFLHCLARARYAVRHQFTTLKFECLANIIIGHLTMLRSKSRLLQSIAVTTTS